MALFTYSARGLKLGISALGLAEPFEHDISGYAPDEFLTIETEDDDWATEEGADGFVVRSMIPNEIQKITLTLQQTSPTNDLLTGLYKIGKGFDITDSIGADIFTFTVSPPISVVQTEGGKTKLFNSTNCYISKIAQLSYGKESGTRSWEITSVGGVFGSDTITSVIQGAGALVRDIGQIAGNVIP
jgi:hypothetical protein